jgi:DNA-binding transcriptional MerR regulator
MGGAVIDRAVSEDEDDDEPSPMSIGQVAVLFDVAPETIRSWQIRYGIGASGTSEGGHRRYNDSDVQRLRLMQRLVAAGHTPAEAARRARQPGDVDPTSSTHPVATRSGRALVVRGGSSDARRLARAAGRLDARAAMAIIGEHLVSEGAARTWADLLVPVLRAAGRSWSQTGDGIEVEHVLTEAIIESLRAYSAFIPKPAPGRMILLAGAPDDAHTLPLHVLGSSLREQRLPSLMLGARVPFQASIAAARRTGAAGVFIWRQLVGSDELVADLMALRGELRPAATIVLAGPGWAEVPAIAGIQRPGSLTETVDVFAHAARDAQRA